MRKLKLRRKGLDELAQAMPTINEPEQMEIVGGGDGTQYSPWTLSEYDSMHGFVTGYVDFGESGGVQYLDGVGASITGDPVAIASSYVGVSEASNMDEIMQMWRYVNDYEGTSESAWCSAFLSAVYSRAGIDNPHTSWAPNWNNWGQASSVPVAGGVAIFQNFEGIEPGHHVGIVESVNGMRITIISGNWGNQVARETYDLSDSSYSNAFSFRYMPE